MATSRVFNTQRSCCQSDGALNGNEAADAHNGVLGLLELSFEYLFAKDSLKWVTITSDQVRHWLHFTGYI